MNCMIFFIAKEKLVQYNLSLYNSGFYLLTCFWWCYSLSNFTINDRISRKRQEETNSTCCILNHMTRCIKMFKIFKIFITLILDMFLHRFRRTHRSLCATWGDLGDNACTRKNWEWFGAVRPLPLSLSWVPSRNCWWFWARLMIDDLSSKDIGAKIGCWRSPGYLQIPLGHQWTNIIISLFYPQLRSNRKGV